MLLPGEAELVGRHRWELPGTDQILLGQSGHTQLLLPGWKLTVLIPKARAALVLKSYTAVRIEAI